MTDLLTQAQQAAAQENWSLLNQYLQQWFDWEMSLNPPIAEKAGRTTTLTRQPIAPESWQKMLNLALCILHRGDFQERWDVAKFFPSLGSGVILPLIALVQDETADSEAHWFAIRILGNFQEPSVIAALIDVLKEGDQVTAATEEEEECEAELSMMAAEVLATFGKPAIAALTELLTERSTRGLAVRSLAQIRTPETIAPLLSTVADADVSIRQAAIEALGSFHDERVLPVLLAALKDAAAPIRQGAVVSLGMRSDLLPVLDLVSLLSPLLLDLNLGVCRHCAIALGRLGTPAAAKVLFERLRSVHTPIALQQEIVRALGWIDSLASLDYLQQALQLQIQRSSATTEISQEIITTVGQIQTAACKPQATQLLLSVLQSPHLLWQTPSIQQAVVLGLAQLGDRMALEPLLQQLAQPNFGIKLHVVAALKTLDAATAYQRLQQWASDSTLPAALQAGVAIALQEW
ncbi:MAG: HEAT repeat domain-containing protein [Scytolyngbya sp. HA4215-MV1]|nr:HEAT repeat domain-containing protein [Scytolyngbya sp. HA4215-MV1]